MAWHKRFGEKPRIEECFGCGRRYRQGTLEYDMVYSTGYCSFCLENVER